MKGKNPLYGFAFCSLLMWSITGCGTQSVTPSVTTEEFHSIVESGRDIYVLDVRTQAEFDRIHLPFVDDLIPYTVLEQHLDQLPQDRNTEMYMFCRSGRRSKIATDLLISKGYTNVHNVEGGIIAWQSSRYDVVVGPK